MKLKIKKLHPLASMPKYATPGSACFDLFAATVDDKSIIGKMVWHTEPVVCDTGLAFEIPPGWVMLIFSRSGHGFNFDVRLANCIGVIDSDYRGSVKVKLTSDLQNEEDKAPLHVKPGERIAQAMLVEIAQIEFEEVTELAASERGQGGFGSTGK